LRKYMSVALLLSMALNGASYAQTARPATPPASGPSTQAPMTAAPTATNQYKTEVAAKQACGTDPVVWANLKSKALHPSGDQYYGKTKKGAYMCQSVAVKEGMHMSKSKG
jgi:hypothetical protein